MSKNTQTRRLSRRLSRRKDRTTSVPIKQIPMSLSRKDRKKVKQELLKSRNLYSKGKYQTRKRVSSYPHTESKQIKEARKIQNVEDIKPSKELAKATGCSITALKEIEKKGMGAYFSSGSRPNQTAHSWGRARLGSAITGGKSAGVDWHILEKGCKKSGKAFRLGKKALKKHGFGTRKVRKVKLN